MSSKSHMLKICKRIINTNIVLEFDFYYCKYDHKFSHVYPHDYSYGGFKKYTYGVY